MMVSLPKEQHCRWNKVVTFWIYIGNTGGQKRVCHLTQFPTQNAWSLNSWFLYGKDHSLPSHSHSAHRDDHQRWPPSVTSAPLSAKVIHFDTNLLLLLPPPTTQQGHSRHILNLLLPLPPGCPLWPWLVKHVIYTAGPQDIKLTLYLL